MPVGVVVEEMGVPGLLPVPLEGAVAVGLGADAVDATVSGAVPFDAKGPAAIGKLESAPTQQPNGTSEAEVFGGGSKPSGMPASGKAPAGGDAPTGGGAIGRRRTGGRLAGAGVPSKAASAKGVALQPICPTTCGRRAQIARDVVTFTH